MSRMPSTELLQGTLDLLILKAVSLGPEHGYGILLRIQQVSRDKLQIQQGSLYPALYRLEHQGLITSEWGESENRRKAKFYRLTRAGTRRLQHEVAYWERICDAIGYVLADFGCVDRACRGDSAPGGAGIAGGVSDAQCTGVARTPIEPGRGYSRRPRRGRSQLPGLATVLQRQPERHRPRADDRWNRMSDRRRHAGRV